MIAPATERIKILEPEADRVHARMAGGASGVIAVLFHALAQGAGEGGFAFLELGDVGWRRRRWRRFKCRSWSHWPAKLSTKALALGSFSMRLTCFSRFRRNAPRSANANNSLSGIELQTK